MPVFNIDMEEVQFMHLQFAAAKAKRSVRSQAAFLLEEALERSGACEPAPKKRRELIDAFRSKLDPKRAPLTDAQFSAVEGMRAGLICSINIGAKPALGRKEVLEQSVTFEFEPWWSALPETVGGAS